LDFQQSNSICSPAVVHSGCERIPVSSRRSGVTRMKKVHVLLTAVLLAGTLVAQTGSQLRFCLHSEPKTFNPLLVQEDSSEAVRYLTAGVLVRLNRHTQELQPELASSWKVSKDGRTITFTLRSGLHF